MLCVQEAHAADGGEVDEHDRPPRRRRAVVAARSSSTARTSCPARAGEPDGRAFCWLEWDHPDMPWDATRLVVDAGGQRTRRRRRRRPRVDLPGRRGRPTGRCGSAATAPGSGACTAGRPRPAPRRWSTSAATSGSRTWVFGESCFAFLDGGRVAFVYVEDGLDRLAVRLTDGTVAPLDLPFTVIQGLRGERVDVLRFIGASPTTEAHVVAVDVDGATAARSRRDRGAAATCRRRRRGSPRPKPIDFPTAGGATAHALLYRPRNPDVTGPAGDRPPLLVVIHGGPTSAARAMLRLGVPVLDDTWLRRRRRQLPRVDGVRAGVPRPAARRSGASPTSRTAPRSAGYLVERGDVDPRPAVHPGRFGRRVHDACRAGLRGRVLRRREPLRRRRPRRAGLATRTSSRAATSTA